MGSLMGKEVAPPEAKGDHGEMVPQTALLSAWREQILTEEGGSLYRSDSRRTNLLRLDISNRVLLKI